MSHTYDYPRAGITTDMAAFGTDSDGVTHLLLIERGHDPWKGQWALPGGFLEMDEELETCACREFVEEVGLTIHPADIKQIGAFGGVDRDPRMRLITIGFTYQFSDLPTPKAGDDAAKARWWPLSDLPQTITDHHLIIEGALKIWDTASPS